MSSPPHRSTCYHAPAEAGISLSSANSWTLPSLGRLACLNQFKSITKKGGKKWRSPRGKRSSLLLRNCSWGRCLRIREASGRCFPLEKKWNEEMKCESKEGESPMCVTFTPLSYKQRGRQGQLNTIVDEDILSLCNQFCFVFYIHILIVRCEHKAAVASTRLGSQLWFPATHFLPSHRLPGTSSRSSQHPAWHWFVIFHVRRLLLTCPVVWYVVAPAWIDGHTAFCPEAV